MTPRPRRAMIGAFLPDGSTFNREKNLLSDEAVELLEMGDPLDDESYVPLLYSRDESPAATAPTAGGP